MSTKTVNVRTIAQVITLPNGAGGDPYQSVSVSAGTVLWRSVRVIIPPGHAGLTEIAFNYAGTQIVPWDDNTNTLFGLPGDYTFPVMLEIDNKVDVLAYNRDVNWHSFYCFFEVEDVAMGLAATVTNPVPL